MKNISDQVIIYIVLIITLGVLSGMGIFQCQCNGPGGISVGCNVGDKK